MCKKKGFTLIELLVVISIIAILMSILMPAMAKIKEHARAVKCKALLRQWGTIWSMYCDDNNTRFSSGRVGNGGWDRGEWVTVLRNLYNTKGDITKCPSAFKPRPDGEEYGSPTNTYNMPLDEAGFSGVAEQPSYGANCWIHNTNEDIQGRPASYHWKSEDSPRAYNIPVFADSMWRGGGPWYNTGEVAIAPPEENGQWSGVNAEMKHFAIDRHSGSVNMLFMDWHVEVVPLKKLWKLEWHKGFNKFGKWAQPDAPWPKWMTALRED